MAHVITEPARSIKEFRLLPGLTTTACTLREVSLETRLCRLGDGFVSLHTPIISAAMQAVTGHEMAIAMAQLGGIGVLPVSQTIEAQCNAVSVVKRFKAGFQTHIMVLHPEQKLAEVLATIQESGYTTFPVTESGTHGEKLIGVLTDKDFDPRDDLEFSVAERMRRDVQAGVDIEDLDAANRLMVEYGRGFLPIVDKQGLLQSVVFKKDRDKHLRHPNETVDSHKRLQVAAAVSTHPEDRERVAALVEHKVDVLLVDASDGFTQFQADTIEWTKQNHQVPIVGGNVVSSAGFDFLVEHGADGVKVGMGIGSGCTTQEVKSTGRGQATAIMDVAAARQRHLERSGIYIPIIADGGIKNAAEAVVALALGADCVMMGNLLARFSESPGQIVRGVGGELFKEYWMEGSLRASNARRYAQTKGTFFEEGIEGWVPHTGSIYDGLPRMGNMMRSAMSTCGCADIDALHRDSTVELQSERCLADSAVHDMRPLDQRPSM